ncbi:MAG: META domain-containing protein [Sulfurospirillaceae bacterium]|jgi:heat shock protein HslJ|nr:META domain-containing protein [Sulfurospirillaceae bacterium]MCK9545226.1 META domain-containing protein [Sulfurospirillaceae bacterium]NLM99022.1 META domain-containing protein [Campylobacteraceae bacterium]
MRYLYLLIVLIFSTGCVSTNEPKVPNVSLKDTYFKLLHIKNSEVIVYENQREPHIVLHSNGNLSGSDGCNLLIGGYESKKDKINFSKVGSTMMACQNGMEQGALFGATLGEAHSYEIDGEQLYIFNKDGEKILVFTAVALK